MEYTKHQKLELTQVLPTNVVKGKGKQNEDKTFKEKATRNWLDLPSDIMINILQRISAIEILYRVEKVCANWRQICKDPSMWRVIYLDDNGIDANCSLNVSFSPWVLCRICKNVVYRSQGQLVDISIKGFCDDELLQYVAKRNIFHVSQSGMILREICKNVVDRSQGQLVDITIKGFCDDELLQYVAERSSQLRRLEIGYGRYSSPIHHLTKALKKFPLLEELSLGEQIGEEAIRTLGRDCPMLKTLKLSNQFRFGNIALGLGIAENLPGLRHLELKKCDLSYTGLRAILDRCCHLQVLDLNKCFPIDLTGELGKRCLEQIKYVKFTHCQPIQYFKTNP